MLCSGDLRWWSRDKEQDEKRVWQLQRCETLCLCISLDLQDPLSGFTSQTVPLLNIMWGWDTVMDTVSIKICVGDWMHRSLSSCVSYILKMLNLSSSAFPPDLKKSFRFEVVMTQNYHTMVPKVYRNDRVASFPHVGGTYINKYGKRRTTQNNEGMCVDVHKEVGTCSQTLWAFLYALAKSIGVSVVCSWGRWRTACSLVLRNENDSLNDLLSPPLRGNITGMLKNSRYERES